MGLKNQIGMTCFLPTYIFDFLTICFVYGKCSSWNLVVSVGGEAIAITYRVVEAIYVLITYQRHQ